MTSSSSSSSSRPSAELLLIAGLSLALGFSLAANLAIRSSSSSSSGGRRREEEQGGHAHAGETGGFEVCNPPKVAPRRRMLPRARTESGIRIDDPPGLEKGSLAPVMSRLEQHIAAATSEEEQAATAAAAADAVAAAPPARRKALTVGVAGGSGSGKTTFARALYEALGEEHVTFITHDSYYKDLSHLPPEERAKANFDHPEALDTALLVEHVRRLKMGEAVEVPEYDFATHCRLPTTATAEPRHVIIVEGILIFSDPALVKELAIKVFIDTESDLRLIRRIHRDVKERGRSLESIVSQYVRTVRPMHMEFVEASKRFADIIIPLGMNSVALDMFLARLQQEISGDDEPAALTALARGQSSQPALVALGKSGSLSL